MLATLVRDRQDLVAEWQKRDEHRNAAMAQAADTRDRALEAASTERLAAIDKRLADIDQRLKTWNADGSVHDVHKHGITGQANIDVASVP